VAGIAVGWLVTRHYFATQTPTSTEPLLWITCFAELSLLARCFKIVAWRFVIEIVGVELDICSYHTTIIFEFAVFNHILTDTPTLSSVVFASPSNAEYAVFASLISIKIVLFVRYSDIPMLFLWFSLKNPAKFLFDKFATFPSGVDKMYFA